ncbi:MAG: IPT/TIG domain-containing protein [Treponemataceae bacterium]|nr:IPT/TIG domain-containing protein [Treponemataceae bacterium]
MKQTLSFSYLLRKYPLFRAAILFILILIAVIITVITTTYLKRPPVIEGMTPNTGDSGDILTIKGSGFGSIQSDSYIELSGERLMASSYISWNNDEIQFILPFHSTDGLVYVITPAGRSNATVFTDKETLPIPASEIREAILPEITSLSIKKGTIGSSLTINGNNFGPMRSDSQIWFTAKADQTTTDSYISCSEFDSDYLFWSDHEIRVRIPDGATTGSIYVASANGISNKVLFEVTTPAGQKKYSDKKQYNINLSMAASDIKASSSASIYIFMPKPASCAWQREINETFYNQDPVILDYTGTAVHQIPAMSESEENTTISDGYKVTVWKIETENKKQTAKAGSISSEYCSKWTLADEIVPADDKRIKDIASSIVKKETSPWKKASLLYSWVVSNFHLLYDPRPIYSEVYDSIETGYADAYDEAIIFTALARAAGIPAIPVAGILVGEDGSSRTHWWAEFYIDEIGWVPADPAMGAGLNFPIASPEQNPASFYFGNLDSSHITISRGYNLIKASKITARNVTRPRTYAIQSIWEEASPDITAYTTKWAPVAIFQED